MDTLRLPLGTSFITAPFMEMVPAVMSSSPAIIRRVVDLPQPEGPSRMSRSPSLISRFRSLTITFFP